MPFLQYEGWSKQDRSGSNSPALKGHLVKFCIKVFTNLFILDLKQLHNYQYRIELIVVSVNVL